MRRDDDVVELEQRAPSTAPASRRRARRRRACPSAAPRRSASSSTSSPRAALITRAPSGSFAIASLSEEAAGLGRQRQVQRQELGDGEHVVRALDALDAELAEALLRDERVVGDDAHPEPERAARDLLADAAEAEHAERLALELDPAPGRALPAALLQRRVRLRDVPRERDEQADGVLGGGDDRRLGRVGDDDPAARGGLDVDVVDADARRGRSPSGGRRARSARRSASSPSGSRSRRSRRSSRRGRRSPSTSTSKRSRSSSTPASAIGSADEDSHTGVLLERLERAGDRDAALDLRAELERARARPRRARS